MFDKNDTPAIIGDGYTQNAYIAPAPRHHPALRFRFRPLMVEERSRLLSENSKLPAKDATRNTARVVAARLESWDATDKKGDSIAVSADSLLRLRPALYDRLLAIVYGIDGSDEDPEAPRSREEKELSLADELEAVHSDRPAGDVREEREVKN